MLADRPELVKPLFGLEKRHERAAFKIRTKNYNRERSTVFTAVLAGTTPRITAWSFSGAAPYRIDVECIAGVSKVSSFKGA